MINKIRSFGKITEPSSHYRVTIDFSNKKLNIASFGILLLWKPNCLLAITYFIVEVKILIHRGCRYSFLIERQFQDLFTSNSHAFENGNRTFNQNTCSLEINSTSLTCSRVTELFTLVLLCLFPDIWRQTIFLSENHHNCFLLNISEVIEIIINWLPVR